MRQINVLVTGIGGPTAQGVMQGLREKDNVYIVGVDRRRVTPGHAFCHKAYQIPPYTEREDYKEAIADIVEKEKIDAIFPSLHEEIDIYAEFRHALHAEVALPRSNMLTHLKDKESVYHYLEKCHLHTYIPKYAGFNDPEELKNIITKKYESDRYVVVKQVDGHGSLGFAILTDRKNYLEALKKGKKNVHNIHDYYEICPNDRKIVMEYLEGPEYSVDVLVHGGKVVTAIPRERTGVSNGLVLDGKVIRHDELIAAATNIAESFVTSGFLNLQFISGKDGYKLTDINPRFCGSQIMSLGAGVNFPYLFLQYLLLGEYVTVTPKWNTRMLRFRDQFFVEEEEENMLSTPVFKQQMRT